MGKRTSDWLVVFVFLGWVHLCPGQYEQSLEYHVHRDTQYKFSELGYAHLTIVESRPGGMNMPDFQCADPLFAQWMTPLVDRGFLWVALDRHAGDNNYTLLYMDTNRDGHLGDESAVPSHRSTARFALFGPVELLLEGDDGPVAYHLNLQYNHNTDMRTFFAWSACWYEASLQVGQKQMRCQLLDQNANGTFNDHAVNKSQPDLIKLGNGDPRIVGQYLEVDKTLYQLEIARHGAWIELAPSELVFSGQVRVPESISELKVMGANGEFLLQPEAGLVTLPEGRYTLSHWTIDRQDKDGQWWQVRGERFYTAQGSFDVEEGPPQELKIGEPLTSEFSVSPQADSHVQFFHKTIGPAAQWVVIKRKYHPISVPHLEVFSRDVTYKRSQPFNLGPGRNWSTNWEESDRERRPYVFKVKIDGPFTVYSQSQLLKPEQRNPPLCGDQVVPVRAQAEIRDRLVTLSGVTDGRGLHHADNDRVLEHDMRPGSMWQAPQGGTPTKLQFDFDRTVNLDLIQVWNYNRPYETYHGLAELDIEIAKEGDTWETVRRGVILEPGEGSDDYDMPGLIHLDGILARNYVEVTLQGILPNSQYWWRVDEVLPLGQIATGPVWSFHTGGLLCWWPFDETQGAQAEDRSGYGSHARLRGHPRWRPGAGRFGGALEFSGAGEGVECTDGMNSPRFIERFTVSTWIKVKAFDQKFLTIITHGEQAWRLQCTHNRRTLRMVLKGLEGRPGTNFRAPGTTYVDDGKWHHVAGTYDGSRLCLYIDGELDIQRLVSGRIPVRSSRVLIGNSGRPWDRSWRGLVDDVRLYNFALSQEQIKALAAGEETLPAAVSGGLPVIVTPASGQNEG